MTNDKQQTAVEWQYIELSKFLTGFSEFTHKSDILIKAKEIEKVRMESTWIAALDYAIKLLKGLNNLESKDAFDQFYNETYGGNK
jgi:hypothetical protein